MSINFKPTYSAYNLVKDNNFLPGSYKPSLPSVTISNTPIGSQKPSFVSGSNNGSVIYTPTYSDVANTLNNSGSNLIVSTESPTPIITLDVPQVSYADVISDKTESTSLSDDSSTTESTPPMTYEEYINSVKKENTATREQAVSYAEAMRQRGLIDARSAYEQSRSAYGSNAQEFSRAGIQGSGYSQYLDSKTYAQMRDEQQSVNATADKAIEKAKYNEQLANNEANGLYASYLMQKEADQKTMFANLFDNIENLSVSDISVLGPQYGLSEEQIKILTDKRQNVSYQTLFDGGYDKSTLDTLLSSGDITQPHYDELLKNLQNIDVDTTVQSFVDSESGELISREEAKANIDALEANGVKEDTLNQMKETFNENYSAITNNVTFKKDDKFIFNTKGDGDKGNNITLKCGDETYKAEFAGGETTNAEVVAAAVSVKEDEVFMYRGKVYLKRGGGKIYELREIAIEQKSFQALKDKLQNK